MTQTRRLAGLDALRGLAALGVLVWHYGAHFGAAPMEAWLKPFYTAGLYLVDVFFVLSGFLLGSLYRDPAGWRAFVFKRVARLFPLHWVTLVVVALLQYGYTQKTGAAFVYTYNDVKHFLLGLGLLQYVGLQDGFSFNGPAWSISVEWLVNLVFVLVLAVPAMRGRVSVLLVVFSAAGLWALGGRVIEGGALWGWLDAAVARGAFGFFAGVFLAELMRGSANLSLGWDGVGVVAGASLLVFMASVQLQQISGLDFVIVALVVPAMVAGCVRGKYLVRLAQLRSLKWLGEVSFSVYLWHFPVQIVMGLIVASGVAIPFASAWVLGGFVATCYLLGHASWVLLEKPAQRVALGSRMGRWILHKE